MKKPLSIRGPSNQSCLDLFCGPRQSRWLSGSLGRRENAFITTKSSSMGARNGGCVGNWGQKMSLKSKVSISMCLLLAVSLCIYAQVPSANSWDWGTHRFITQNAINVMPSSLSWFFTGYSSTIVSYCTLPDAWKSSDPYEQYRHWYHMDIPHDESDYADGVLPWAVEDNFNMLVQYLMENDWNHAAQLAGVIGHYIEDASMPLHATSDYNPGNNHTAYESRVDYQISIDNVNADVPGFVPHKLDNIFDSTMQLLEDSYSNTDVLSFYLEYNTLWNDEIKNLTENRLRTDIPMLANIWYTAFVQAGISSSPPSPQPSTHSRNYTPYIVGGVFAIAVISIVITLHMRRR